LVLFLILFGIEKKAGEELVFQALGSGMLVGYRRPRKNWEK